MAAMGMPISSLLDVAIESVRTLQRAVRHLDGESEAMVYGLRRPPERQLSLQTCADEWFSMADADPPLLCHAEQDVY
jgi:hypothetical protein